MKVVYRTSEPITAAVETGRTDSRDGCILTQAVPCFGWCEFHQREHEEAELAAPRGRRDAARDDGDGLDLSGLVERANAAERRFNREAREDAGDEQSTDAGLGGLMERANEAQRRFDAQG